MNKNLYFYRIAVYTHYQGDTSLVVVQDNNRLYPLDEWLGTIINLADGRHTVTDFISYIGRQYPAGPPDNFEDHVEEMFQHLIDIQALRLASEPVELPYYLAMPAEQQDVEKAKALMIEDGFIPEDY